METRTIEALHRRAAFVPSTVNRDARTVELTWTTGATVRRSSLFDGPFLEELTVSPDAVRLDRLNAGAALLNNHQSSDVRDVIGVVERAWLEGNEGRAVVRFSERADVDPIWADVAAGILRNISVGYRVEEWEERPPASPGALRTFRAKRWEPYELSVVPVPADAGAQVRSDEPLSVSQAMTDPTSTAAAGIEPAAATRQQEPDPVVTPPTTAESDVSREELKRQREILKLCADAGQPADRAQSFIDRGLTFKQASMELIRALVSPSQREGDELSRQLGEERRAAGIKVVRDSQETFIRGVEGAILRRALPTADVPEEANRFRGMSLMEIARAFLEEAGVDTTGWSRSRLAGEALGGRGFERAAAFHSTSSLPYILANSAEKVLRVGYEEEPQTFKAWTSQRNLPDFKTAEELQMAGNWLPEKILEGGEYKAFKLTEGKATWRIDTYGMKVVFTRQMLINDDLSAVEEVPNFIGRAFRRRESNMIYDLITNGSLGATYSGDNLALFHANHSNTFTGALHLGTGLAKIQAGKVLMAKQKGIDGEAIGNLRPSFLLVPPDREMDAMQILFPNGYVPNTLAGVNTIAGSLTPIVESRLGDDSTTMWYLVAPPSRIPGIQYGYLAGEEGVSMETIEFRDPDGMKMLARFDFGCTIRDYRFIVRGSGADS